MHLTNTRQALHILNIMFICHEFILTLSAVEGSFRDSAAAAETQRLGLSLVYLLGLPGCCLLHRDDAAQSRATGRLINLPASGSSQSSWCLWCHEVNRSMVSTSPLSPTLPVVGGVLWWCRGQIHTDTHTEHKTNTWIKACRHLKPRQKHMNAFCFWFFSLSLSRTHKLTMCVVNLRTCSNKLWVKNSSI